MTNEKEYALYRGDDFIMIGTLKEIAKEMEVKENTAYWYTTKAAQKKMEKGKLKTVLVGV